LATSIVSSVQDNAYAAFFPALFNAMSVGGWVRAGDTGQLLAISGSPSNGIQGYQIWRMNDTLQSTAPIYMKIKFGAITSNYSNGSTSYNGYSAYPIQMSIQIGEGTDGSGNIVNEIIPETYLNNSNQNKNLNSYNNYFCMTPSSFNFSAMPACGYPIYVGIERTKDSSGNDTAEGIYFLSKDTSLTMRQIFGSALTNKYEIFYETRCFYPTGITTLASGPNFSLVPIVFGNLYGLRPSPTYSLVHPTADFASYTTITLPLNGNTRTFLASGAPVGLSYSPSAYYAMLWE
jgi:hypothetical protein